MPSSSLLQNKMLDNFRAVVHSAIHVSLAPTWVIEKCSSLSRVLSLRSKLADFHAQRQERRARRRASAASYREFLAAQARDREPGVPEPEPLTVEEAIVILSAFVNGDAGLVVSAQEIRALQAEAEDVGVLVPPPPPTPFLDHFDFASGSGIGDREKKRKTWNTERGARHTSSALNQPRRRSRSQGGLWLQRTPDAIVQELAYDRMLASGVCKALDEAKTRDLEEEDEEGDKLYFKTKRVEGACGSMVRPRTRAVVVNPAHRPVIVRTQRSLGPMKHAHTASHDLVDSSRVGIQGCGRRRLVHTAARAGSLRPLVTRRDLPFQKAYGHERRYVSLVGASVAIMQNVRKVEVPGK